MTDLSAAFSKQFSGVSFWETTDGQIQCNLRRRGQSSTFAVGIGATVDEALARALNKPAAKPRRNDEDLL